MVEAPTPSDEQRDGGRILYFLPDGFPTYRADISALFGKFLPRLGIGSDLVTHRTSDDPAPWPAGEVFAPPPNPSRAGRKLGVFLNDLRTLFGRDARAYLALQVRDKPLLAPLVLAWARIRRRPAIYWMSFPISEFHLRAARDNRRSMGLLRYAFLMVSGGLGQTLLYALLPRFDHVFVQSDLMLDQVAARGVPRALMTAVPMCIDADRYADPPPPPAPRDTVTLCYLGTCDRMRRIDFLFEALALARVDLPNVRLIIAGDAPEEADRHWLRARLAECGVGDIATITGWLSSEAAQAIAEDSDICLSLVPPDPILDVGTPTKLVEYLAMGRAVVANDQPDHRAVIDASGGGLCTPFDPAHFAAAIVELAKDPERRARMGTAGRVWVLEHRSYDAMARTVAAAYRSVLQPAR